MMLFSKTVLKESTKMQKTTASSTTPYDQSFIKSSWQNTFNELVILQIFRNCCRGILEKQATAYLRVNRKFIKCESMN